MFDIVSRVEQAHDRIVLTSNISMCTNLATEIIGEIVEFVVKSSGGMSSDTSMTSQENAPSQEVAVRNLAMELEEDIHVEHVEESKVIEDIRDDQSMAHPPFSFGSQPMNETSTEFEEIWTKRKLDVEKSAEGRARVVFRQWQRDRVTLTQAIDESLKEYADMYEKAHALRLMFEEEKSQFSRQAMMVHAEDTPYGYSGDSKRRRCDTEWAPPQPAWPYPQRQSLDSEFQYTVEESQDVDDPSAHTASSVNRDFDGSNVISPQQKKTYKKFTVPTKLVPET